MRALEGGFRDCPYSHNALSRLCFAPIEAVEARRLAGRDAVTTHTSLNRVQALRLEDILDAALELFGKDGVEATRMIDIANAAEIGKGTLYLHFPTKDALFEEVLRRTLLPAIEIASNAARAPEGSALELLKQQLTLMAERLCEGDMATALRLVISEGLRYPSVKKLYFEEVVAKGVEAIKRILEYGVQIGEFRPDVADLNPIVLTGPTFMTAVWQMLFQELSPIDREEILDQQYRLITERLTAPKS